MKINFQPRWTNYQIPVETIHNILGYLLRNVARQALHQQIFIWCIVLYRSEIVNAMFSVFSEYFETPCIKWMFRTCQTNSLILQPYRNFSNVLFNYIQDFGAKFNLTYHNNLLSRTSLKPGSHIVVTVVIFGNCKQVQANSERNLSQLLQLICSLYAWTCLRVPTITIYENQV